MPTTNRKEICGQCAAMMKERGIKLLQTGGRTDKLTCSQCGKRRYGTEYEIEMPKRRREKHETTDL